MAEMIPFPAARRIGFIRRTARATASYRAEGAARFIDTAVDKHRTSLLRAGVDAFTAHRETEALRSAIYVERARLLNRRGDVA